MWFPGVLCRNVRGRQLHPVWGKPRGFSEMFGREDSYAEGLQDQWYGRRCQPASK